MIDSLDSDTRPQDLSLDFEVTDFETARQALDELPAGVTSVMRSQPNFWAGKRRPQTPTDRALSGQAMEWFAQLPQRLRPVHLSTNFPRIVNRIAAAWHSDVMSRAVFEELLRSPRAVRTGFPLAVRNEIVALSAHRLAIRGH